MALLDEVGILSNKIKKIRLPIIEQIYQIEKQLDGFTWRFRTHLKEEGWDDYDKKSSQIMILTSYLEWNIPCPAFRNEWDYRYQLCWTVYKATWGLLDQSQKDLCKEWGENGKDEYFFYKQELSFSKALTDCDTAFLRSVEPYFSKFLSVVKDRLEQDIESVSDNESSVTN